MKKILFDAESKGLLGTRTFSPHLPTFFQKKNKKPEAFDFSQFIAAKVLAGAGKILRVKGAFGVPHRPVHLVLKEIFHPKLKKIKGVSLSEIFGQNIKLLHFE